MVVVNKSDLPGANQVKLQLENQLSLPAVPVLAVSTTKQVGLAELWIAIELRINDE